jgi:hypothetical protein
MWHIDTTVIRLLDGIRACLHAVIDNYSGRILTCWVADTFAPVNSVAVLLEASRGATPSETTQVRVGRRGRREREHPWRSPRSILRRLEELRGIRDLDETPVEEQRGPDRTTEFAGAVRRSGSASRRHG